MEEILRELGLEAVWPAFLANNIGPNEAVHLSDSNFEHLGVSKVGDRIRIKQKCTGEVDSNAKSSLAVLKLRQLVRNHRLKQDVKATSDKPTRRIYAGWKHEGTTGMKQVSASRGGGSYPLDLPRSASMHEVEMELCSLFFPGGRNESQKIEIDGVDRRVTTFSGKCVMDFDVEESFTLEDLQVLKTNPVRIYLETKLKQKENEDGGDEDSDGVDSSGDGDGGLPDVNVYSNGGMRMEVREASNREAMQLPIEQPDTPTVSFPRHVQAGLRPTHSENYQAYLDLFAEDEGEELEIERSIPEIDTCEIISLDDLLGIKRTLSELVQGEEINIVVHRRKINASAMRAIKSETFSFWKPMKVTFSGEEAEDGGGPSREFFHLLMTEVRMGLGVFESSGDTGVLTFTHNLDLLRQQTYRVAGQYVTWSFVNGGPGLEALCPSTFAAMVGRDVKLDDVKHISSEAARENITKMVKCEGQQEFEELLAEQFDWLIRQGVTKLHGLKLDRDRDRLCKDLLLQQVYYRVQPAIMQFVEGLGPLWQEVKQEPGVTSQLFVYNDKPLKFADVKKLYDVNYSIQGSNYNMAEQDTIYSFEVFLQNCHEGKSELSLEKVLEFWTASHGIPPCGFPRRPQVDFYTRDTGIRRLPSSHTFMWTNSVAAKGSRGTGGTPTTNGRCCPELPRIW